MLYRVWATSVAAEDGELYKPQASLLDTYLSDTQKPCTQARGTCKDINPARLFIIRKQRRLSTYLSVEEWIIKLWCIHTKEYYVAGK